MATGITPPDAAAARIIAHMNGDHQDSLVRYLEHYHGLSSFSASNAHLVDVSLGHLLISTNATKKPAKGTTQPAGSTSYTIPLDPPMKSWSEARQRFADMDHECQRALGRKDITLKQYLAPQGFQVVVTIVCLVTFATLHRRANLSPDTAPQSLKPLLERFPRIAEYLWRIQPRVFRPLVAIHTGEAIYMHFSRLRPLSVPTGSPLWMKWIASTLIGGFGNMQRVDGWVKLEEKRKASAKH